MPNITSVEVYGFNGDPVGQTGNPNQKTVRRARYNPSQYTGNQRFGALRANSARIEGTELDQVRGIRLSSPRLPDYHFALLEREVVSPELIYIWFVAWSSGRKPLIPMDSGDLTVTIDTVDTPAGEDDGNDGSVDYED